MLNQMRLLTMGFLKILLLFGANTPQNEAQQQPMVDFLECPKEETPINILRENDSKKLSIKELNMLHQIQNEFKQILAIESTAADKNWLKDTDNVKQLNAKVVIWHFSFFIEDSLKEMKQLKNRIASEIGVKIADKWEQLFVQNDIKNNVDKTICLLQGFAHRIIQNDILNRDPQWAAFAQSVTIGVLDADDDVKMQSMNKTFNTLTEDDYAMHAKMCAEADFANKIASQMLAPKTNGLIYRLCILALISNLEEFRHFLCYNKNIDNYKEWLYYLMGRNELYLLEESQPYILQIEQISESRCMDGYHDQFQYRTGSPNAVNYELRLAIRRFLGDTIFEGDVQLIRQKANMGMQFAVKMLRKINEVKKAVLAPDTVGTSKGICMLIKLRITLSAIHKFTETGNNQMLPKNIEQWWPNVCDQRKEAERVFKTQRVVLQEKNRASFRMYNNFMLVWTELVTERGAATRLHKFLQMSESEIELKAAYGDAFTDPKVFRSHALLECHYLNALTATDEDVSTQQKAMKLAVDLWVWVNWLEKEVLELTDNKTTNFKLPRFTMGWRQNRWYYEMVYDQLFDIETEDKEAELERKRVQIGTLLQLSKNMVEQKLKMSDEKLKVELRTKKLERLKLEKGTAPPPPPNGTVDREWYDIRRVSESASRVRQSVDREGGGGEESAIQKWLKQRHFKQFTEYLSKCYTFNAEFIKKSIGTNKLFLGQIVGDEKVSETYNTAESFLGKLEKSDDHCHESAEMMAQKEESEKILANAADEKDVFDVDAAMAKFDLENDKTPKNSSKNKSKNNNKQTKTAKKISTKNPKKIEFEIISREKDGANGSKELQHANTNKPHLLSPTELFLSPQEQFSDQQQLPVKTPMNSPNLSPTAEKLGRKNEESGGIGKGKSNSERGKEGGDEEEKEDEKETTPTNDGGRGGGGQEGKGAAEPTKKKQQKRKWKKNNGANRNVINSSSRRGTGEEGVKEEEEEEEEEHGGKGRSSGRMAAAEEEEKEEMTTTTDSTDCINDDEEERKELEKFQIFDNESGWQKFLDDDFLAEAFQTFFMGFITEVGQQVVSIGCQINEIGHRMEVINKLYPIEDQKRLNEFVQLGIAPSKWTHKKLGLNWQQIKRQMLTRIKKDDNQQQKKKSDQIIISPIKSNNAAIPADKFGLHTLRHLLWKQLKIVVKFADVNASSSNASHQLSEDENEAAIDVVGKQIILLKMALAFFTDEKRHFNKTQLPTVQFGTENLAETHRQQHLNVVWHKLSNEKREKIIKALFGEEMNLDTFAVFMDHFSAMVQQNEQDSKLANELSAFTTTALNLCFTANSVHLQELNVFTAEAAGHSKNLNQNDSGATEEKKMLYDFLSKSGYGLFPNDRMVQIDAAIRTIEKTAQQWNPSAKLLITGSYQFGVLTKQSDIDATCVVPVVELVTPSSTAAADQQQPQFVGKAKCEIRSNGHRICADNSFYCHLCLLPQVLSIRSIQNAWMPLIELTFRTGTDIIIDFDIGFATFDQNEPIFQSDKPINYEQSNALSKKLADEIVGKQMTAHQQKQQQGRWHFVKGKELNNDMDMERKRKLRSLSAFEAGAIIFKKLLASEKEEHRKRNILDNYRTLLLAIKMWAKEHHIYDNKLGFFNGISLSILVAKVMLLYPMASVPFLVEKFFFTYATWPWPVPVKLTDLPEESALRWTPNEEMQKRREICYGMVAELTMPIVTPGHIEQNATFNINPSTATIIQREIRLAIKSIRNWPTAVSSEEAKWENVLRDKNFEEKYSHFIRITCTAPSLAVFYDFCGFVETRIRLQLLLDVERFEHIRLAHAKQIVDVEQLSGEYYRKIWLIGLEIDDDDHQLVDDASSEEGRKTAAMNWAEWAHRLDSMLAHLFDANIERAYRRKNHLMGKSLPIELRTIYEKGNKKINN